MNGQLFITDDNHDFVSFLETVAINEGWPVTTCGDGNELVEALGLGQKPAFVLLDMFMPSLNGIETIEKLIEVERPMRLRLITGVFEVDVLAAQMTASARGLNIGRTIYKPVSVKEFRPILQEDQRALLGFCD